jgi:hypothetical protein
LGSLCIAVLTTLTTNYKNELENARLMDNYYVIEIIGTLNPCFGVIINIVSKEDITYGVIIGDIRHYTCIMDFIKMSSHALGKKGK